MMLDLMPHPAAPARPRIRFAVTTWINRVAERRTVEHVNRSTARRIAAQRFAVARALFPAEDVEVTITRLPDLRVVFTLARAAAPATETPATARLALVP